MSRAERAAAALNDIIYLFEAEDKEGLHEVALDYFTGDTEEGESDCEQGKVLLKKLIVMLQLLSSGTVELSPGTVVSDTLVPVDGN